MSGPDQDFRARLRRLRRDPAPHGGRDPESPGTPGLPEESDPEPQGPGAEQEGPGARAGLPDWLRGRLSRSAVFERRTLGLPRDLAEARHPRGPFAFRRTLLDPAVPHGDWRLREVDHVDRAGLALLSGDPAVAGIDPRTAVYLDIETTGLCGGAGTVPFMVCLGSFTKASPGQGGFELWQGFLRDPSEEPAMLAEVAERVASSSGVVSFFGKSFDRHRLEDKMRMHGVAPPFAARPHLDLYHPCRRLYRAAFDDARLQTLERGLCGVVREHDLPGSHAPAAWFDFLSDRPHLCEQVFLHNLLDVLSLVTLHAHLGRSLVEARSAGTPLDGEGSATARSRAVALARFFDRRREPAAALFWCERARARGADGREQSFLRAVCLARAGHPEAAREAFRALGAARDPLAARALFEAARLSRGDEQRALLSRAGRLAELFDARLAERIARRLARL